MGKIKRQPLDGEEQEKDNQVTEKSKRQASDGDVIG
jgi:hypothetical protein